MEWMLPVLCGTSLSLNHAGFFCCQLNNLMFIFISWVEEGGRGSGRAGRQKRRKEGKEGREGGRKEGRKEE